MLIPISDGMYQFQNINGHVDTKGAETSIKITVDEFEIYLGYTYTDPILKDNGARYSKPLTPKHRLNNLIMCEIESSWRFGLEVFYYGRQYLDDRTKTPDYWLFGFLAEKIWKHVSIYANIENITDRRQTRFENINMGTVANPVFREIYAPLDGIVANVGVKIR
jgi:iron complex outermembrane receptor protein